MFTFIKEDELNIRKFEHIIDSASDEDNSILEDLEQMSISQIKVYLDSKYDTDIIFSRVDNERNPTIKRMVLDYMVYFLFERVSSNEIPEYIKERYIKNEKMLMDFAKGILNPNLPNKDASIEFVSGFKGGSNTPFINI